MLFVGFDPSLRNTGYCILGEDGRCVYAGKISTPYGLPQLASLYSLGQYVERILKGRGKVRVGIEGMAVGVHILRTEAIWAAYVVREAIFRSGFNYIDIPSTSLKKFITGNGHTKKNLMLKFVYKNFGYDFDSDDVADAFGVARFLYDCWNPTGKITKEREKQINVFKGKHQEYFKSSDPLRTDEWKKWAEIRKSRCDYHSNTL